MFPDDRGKTDQSGDRLRAPWLRRRTLLRAVGAGAALSAIGAAAAQDGDSSDDGGTGETPADETPDDGGTGETPADETPDGTGDGGEIDPVYGMTGFATDEPPTEPDHVVELLIRPRENAPIPEFIFQPTGLAIEPGDTVQFSAVTPHHTVTAYHPAFGYQRRVPEDVPPFSSPALTAEGYWLYTFDAEGVYDYHCAPHEVYGHAGRIVVGEDVGDFEPLPDPCAGEAETETPAGTATPTPTPTPTPETTTAETAGEGEGEGGEVAPEPPRLTAYTVLRDPALAPENVLDAGEVRWEELADESKQLFLQLSGFPPCE
jgi:plastocyanin